MSIEEIRIVLPPPAQPIEDQGDWFNVEVRLSARLPQDYKSFIETYGTGRVDRFLWVLNPFSENDNLNLLVGVQRELDALRDLRDQFQEKIPYPLFPTAGGLLPFAATDNGDVLHWQTSGDPDNWHVIVNESRSPVYEEFNVSMTDFLVRLLTRQISSQIFPRNFPGNSPAFEATKGSRNS